VNFGGVKRFFVFFGETLATSPGFHQVLSIHQVFTRFSDFSPSLGDQSGGFRIASSFHCSDGRYVILKETFFFGTISREKRKKHFVLSLEHAEHFFGMNRWWIPGKQSVSNLTTQ